MCERVDTENAAVRLGRERLVRARMKVDSAVSVKQERTSHVSLGTIYTHTVRDADDVPSW